MSQVPCVFRNEGESLDYTPGSAVTAGDVVLQGTMIGIAKSDIAANALGSLCVQGVFTVPKDSSNMSAVGTAIYWDADGTPVGGTAVGAFTVTPTGNTFAGWCLEVAGAGVATVKALIKSSFAVSVTTIDDLTDVGTVDYAAGSLIVGDGAKFENVPVSGALTLAATGLVAVKSATIAASGTGSGDSAITEGITLVTAADATKAVTLPTAAAGKLCIIKNNANAVLKVFPGTSDKINGGTATTGQLAVAAYASVILVAYDATDWYSIPLLPS
jgi:predicted RecA/RadA family phage recombinase